MPRLLLLSALAAGVFHLSAAQAGLPDGVNGICLYEHPDLLGAEWCYSADAGTVSIANDKASSFRLFGDVAVTLFEHTGFSGQQTTVMMDAYDMDILEDKVSSLRIRTRQRKDFACVYEHFNYSGTGSCAEAGSGVAALPQYNMASSIMIAGSAYVHGFAYDNFNTSQKNGQLFRSYGDLNDAGWNDDFDSFRVEHWDLAQDSWDNRRRHTLQAQEQIATQSALYKTTWLGSHNAYNADGYVKTFSGRNHDVSLAEQLDMGSRVLEIDIHGNGTVVYHTPDAGVVGARSSLTRYLVEINNWLKGADADDVVFIKVEDLMNDGAQPEEWAAWNIQKTLGNLVLRKAAGETGCEAMPAQLSVADIAKSGKRVVFWSNKCGGENANYMNIVWARGGAEGGRDTDWNSSCGDTPSRWGQTGNLSLINEDARWGAKLVGVGGQLPNHQLRSALECGMLHLMTDELHWGDSARFWAFSWAWPRGVNGNNGECGIYQRDNRSIQSDQCASQRRFVCRDSDDSLFLSRISGNWQQGNSVCATERREARFSLPSNAREGRLLRELQAQEQDLESWINARRIGTDWVAQPERNFFRLVEKQSGMCLDVPGDDNGLFDGQNVQTWECQAESRDKKWYYDHSSGQVHNLANPQFCLDNRGQNQDGGSLGVWSCVAHPNLQFERIGEVLRPRGASQLTVSAENGSVNSRHYQSRAGQHWQARFD